jgi:hypothetical protein
LKGTDLTDVEPPPKPPAPGVDPSQVWAVLADALQRVAKSPECTPAHSEIICKALDRFTTAVMGEAEEDMARLDWTPCTP